MKVTAALHSSALWAGLVRSDAWALQRPTNVSPEETKGKRVQIRSKGTLKTHYIYLFLLQNQTMSPVMLYFWALSLLAVKKKEM